MASPIPVLSSTRLTNHLTNPSNCISSTLLATTRPIQSQEQNYQVSPQPSPMPPYAPCLPSITVFTDSLASIYLILRSLHTPRSLFENKHAPLILHIRSLLLARSRLGYHTNIHKVISHTGITGNELADTTATTTLSCNACDYTLSDIDNQYLASLPAWPCLPPPPSAPDTPDPDPWFASNLHDTITSHLQSLPSITDGYIKP